MQTGAQGLDGPKIGGLNYLEGFLFVLHDIAQVVRVWDIETGKLLSQWKLPVAVDGSERGNDAGTPSKHCRCRCY